MGGFSGGPSPDPGMPNGEPSTAAAIKIGGETLTVSSSGIGVAGSIAAPGGAPIAVSGTSISLDPSGTVYVTGNPTALSPYVSNQSPSVFTIADQTFTASPSGFFIAGSSVLPGQAPVTIPGTRVALALSGNLIVGSSTVQLQPTNHTTKPASLYRR